MQFLPSTTAVKAADLKKEREGVKKGRVKMILSTSKLFLGLRLAWAKHHCVVKKNLADVEVKVHNRNYWKGQNC